MQAYRSLHSYKQRYIHRNQYNETCNRKKKINIWLIFVLGTAVTNLNTTKYWLYFPCTSLLQTLQHYYMSIYLYANSRNPYDGDERNVVAWWSKSPLRRQRKVDDLGWTGPRASGPAFGIIISCQRAWGVEHQRGGGGVGIGLRWDLWNFGNHVFLEGIDLVWTT